MRRSLSYPNPGSTRSIQVVHSIFKKSASILEGDVLGSL
jgi:hypothetical protein